MSYKVINQGRVRSLCVPADRSAKAAAQFRSEREQAGLPVATDEQMKRAQRLVEGSPTMRRHHTPLGMQLLALGLPLSKRERVAQRVKVETDDEGNEKRVEGIVLQPHRSRGDHLQVEADAGAVQRFIDANPEMTEAEAAQTIVGMHGYADATSALRRVERWTNSAKKGRVANHIREKAVMLSAIAQATLAIRDRAAGAVA